jgi:excinuclease ABC subunit A
LRARIDGEVIYLDNMDELDGKIHHTIEIVVDRLKVREDIASRLSESLETALNLSAGLVRIASLDADSIQEELVFSAKFSCTKCGYSLTAIEFIHII